MSPTRGTEPYGIFEWGAAQAALRPANLTTLPHFSVSSAISLPKSAGIPGSGVPPRSASRALHLGVREARIDLLVEFVNDRGRTAFRCADGNPTACLITHHEITHRRDVRQRLRRAAVVMNGCEDPRIDGGRGRKRVACEWDPAQ
jgi:hypothetical protein